MALVLTHNAPASLERCLEAIAKQSLLPESVLVVDNASDPRVEAAGLRQDPVPAKVVRSDVNTGPAGGWALALDEFLKLGVPLAWVMDDDMEPEVDCLERLWERVRDDPRRAFAFPRNIDLDGSWAQFPSWCGFLVAREVVDAAGLPMEGLFWWAEDTEYLRFRIPRAGFDRQNVKDARVHHSAIRRNGPVPLWKYYYEARNMLYVHLYVMRKVGRYPKSISKLVGRALLRDGPGRTKRIAVIARGLFDGAFRRLGVRYPVSSLQERTTTSGTLSG